MKKMDIRLKSGNDIFWGVIFVLLAVLVIISEMGWIQGVGFWTIVFSVIFGAALVKGIFKCDFPQILFSLAFLCIVWDDVLGIEQLTPWPVLLAATLGSVGFSMIFGSTKYEYQEKYYEAYRSGNGAGDTIEQESGENIKCSVSFGSIVKYVNSDDLRSVYVSASFGAASIYLDNAHAPSGEVIVKIDSSFSGVQLFVPRDWRVVDKMSSSFAGVKEENRCTGVDAVNVILTGSANFSGVTVTYI